MRIIRIIMRLLLAAFLFLAANSLVASAVEVWRAGAGFDSSAFLDSVKSGLLTPSFDTAPLAAGIAASLGVALLSAGKPGAHGYSGSEHGSAFWGTKADIQPFWDKSDYFNNILLSATEGMRLDKNPSFRHDRNKNVVVVGGSGSGKTHSIIIPNLMQMHSSYIVTDSKGSIQAKTVQMFKKAGYRIRVLDVVNFNRSNSYNPMAYLKSEDDILKLVNVFISNTNGEKGKAGGGGDDAFWDKSEKLFLTAAIAYIFETYPAADRTFEAVHEFVSLSATSEEDESYVSGSDDLIAELKKKNPHSFAVRQYEMFLLATGKTRKSILVSVAVRLAPFGVPKLRTLTARDEMAFESIGLKKTILYVNMSDTDETYQFLVAMMLYQLFNTITEQADAQPGGALPVPVRLLLDEFANSATRSRLKRPGLASFPAPAA